MRQMGVFSILELGGGLLAGQKSPTLVAKYKDWWFYPGHRQMIMILELYETE